jgi:acetylornithine/LysW-gamma-L-lysine aminotransferase
LSVTSGRHREAVAGLLVPQPTIELGDLDALGRAVDSDTAAVIVEPIQGEGGLRAAPEGFLAAVQSLCRERGVLLIIDEIQTGAGRTGWFTECERQRLVPDILCLGKGLAGGFPVGIVAVSSAVATRLPRGLHTSTFGGNPVAAAGVLAALSLLTEDRLARVRELGGRLSDGLRAAGSAVLGVRGRGLMLGVQVRAQARDTVLKTLQKGRVLAIPAGDDVVRFLPSLLIDPVDIDRGLETIVPVLSESGPS